MPCFFFDISGENGLCLIFNKDLMVVNYEKNTVWNYWIRFVRRACNYAGDQKIFKLRINCDSKTLRRYGKMEGTGAWHSLVF